MGQPLCVNCDVTLDAGHFFPASYPLCSALSGSHEGRGEEWKVGDIVGLGLCLDYQLDASFPPVYQLVPATLLGTRRALERVAPMELKI
jgi:hypothetical protein